MKRKEVHTSCKRRGRKADRRLATVGWAARQAWQQVGRPRRRDPSASRAAPPQGAPAVWGVASSSPALLAGDRAGGRLAAAAAQTWLRWWSRWGWSGVSAPGGPAHPPRPASGTPVPAPPPRSPGGWAGRSSGRGRGGAPLFVGVEGSVGLAGPGAAPTAQPFLCAFGGPGAQDCSRSLLCPRRLCGCPTGTRLSFLGSVSARPYSVSGRIAPCLSESLTLSLRPAPAPQTCPGLWSSSSGSSAAGNCPRRSCRPSSESFRAASALPSGR